MATPPPGLIIRYLDCGASVIKESYEDYPGAGFGPIAAGCFEISAEQYEIRRAEIQGQAGQAKAAMLAVDDQTAADAAAQAAALTLVDGPVTDDSFPEGTPLVDGTMAVDTKNGRVYVRLAGEWKSAALV